MKTRIFITITLSLVMANLVVGVASAAEVTLDSISPGIVVGDHLNFGEITTLSYNEFTVTTRSGRSHTYLVDDDTRYRIKNVENPSFSNLELGHNVLVAAKLIDGELLAKIVVVFPEGYNPFRWFDIRVRGEISDLNSDEQTIAVLRPSGEQVVFTIGDRTRFIGSADNINDLEMGWVIGVAGGKKDDGTNFATIVVVAQEKSRVRYVGTISSVDEINGSVSILTHNNEEIMFNADEKTIFLGRNNEITSISQLQLNMAVLFVGLVQEDGSYLATHIAAVDKEDLPDYEVKKIGHIISLNSKGLIIETKDHEEVFFSTNAETIFRGRRKGVHSLEDLSLGMKVFVGGIELETGEILAQMVISFLDTN